MELMFALSADLQSIYTSRCATVAVLQPRAVRKADVQGGIKLDSCIFQQL
jgi:hypothetical protein